MRRLLGLLCLGSATFGCGRAAHEAHIASLAAEPAFYDLYKPGDPVTDQASGASGAHSSLVGMDGGDTSIVDTDFAANVATPALKAGASLFFSLGECFSGGFLDDMAPLKGNQAIITSARHTETASYGFEPPEGVNIDFTDSFIKALGDGHVPAMTVAAQTAALDPFGPNPDAPRITESMGGEHTQYFATGSGADLTPADHAGTGMAVLWAGMPNDRDGAQMNLMIDHLVTMGFDRDRIWLMYGGGEADATHPVVRGQIINQANPIHLLSATREHLVDLFAATFAPEAQAAAPDFVFLYVGDHGGLDGAATAKRNFGHPDRLVTPMIQRQAGTHLYGEGNRDLKIK